MENGIIQHQLSQSSQYKTQPKLYMVQATQLGSFYSQRRETNTLKSGIHPSLWKVSTICDSAFVTTFLSRDLKVSTEFLIFEELKFDERNPTQIYHKQLLFQFWIKYLLGKLILDENGRVILHIAAYLKIKCIF